MTDGPIIVLDTQAPELRGLILDRQRLMRQYAKILRRIGASNPKRSQLNRKRAAQRLELRRAMRQNANEIAAYLLRIVTP